MALAGSVAVAFGAYGLGSQIGGGTSGAATATGAAFHPVRPMGGPGGPDGAGLQDLATRLGVSQDKLRAALDAIGKSDPQAGGDPRTVLEKALADGLNVPQSKVAAALDKLMAKHDAAEAGCRTAFEATLAKGLGIDAAKVKAAFDKLRPDRAGARHARPLGPGAGPGGFLSTLAKELGVDQSKLRAALEKVRPAGPGGPRFGPRPGGPRFGPDPGGHRFGPHPGGPRFGPHPDGPPSGGGAFRHEGGPGGPPDQLAADLAQALGVDRATVQSVLDKLHAQMESQMQARHDRFAAALAGRLGLSVQKVKDALAAGHPSPGRTP